MRRQADRAGAVGAEMQRPAARPRRARRRRRTTRRRSCPCFQGLCVAPVSGLWLTAVQPCSVLVVLPRMMAPAARSRATSGASAVAGAGSEAATRAGSACPCHRLDVLDGDRHAVQRSERIARASPPLPPRGPPPARAPASSATKALSRGLHRGDAGQHRLGDLHRRGALLAHHRRHFHRRGGRQVSRWGLRCHRSSGSSRS